MGCDIHLFTEEKIKINNIEKWVNVDNWVINPYYEQQDGSNEYQINEAYRHRNYTLFSILADVRNYSDNEPICEPKGLPDDVSEVVKKQSNGWGDDGHSHSFFTMQELYEYYETHKTVKHSGLVDQEGAKQIDSGKMPAWCCQASTDESLIYREWESKNVVFKDFIETLEKHFNYRFYRKENAENFRIVFWFDN